MQTESFFSIVKNISPERNVKNLRESISFPRKEAPYCYDPFAGQPQIIVILVSSIFCPSRDKNRHVHLIFLFFLPHNFT